MVFNQWVVFVNVVQMVYVLEEEVSHVDVNGLLDILNLTACRGVDTQLLPGDVQRFKDCVVVNGDLIFNIVTYDEFM